MKKNILKLSVFLFLAMIFMSGVASAASVQFEVSKDTVSVGDTFIVSVKLNSQDVVVNSAEGEIVFGSKVNSVVNDFSLSKSVFTLWPRTPSLSKEGDVVSFVGGIPGGLVLKNATIFNIVVEAQKEGEIEISSKNIVLFSSDGKGTKLSTEPVKVRVKVNPNVNGQVTQNDWTTLVLSDKKSPHDFPITIGRESSMFEGKRFAFFTAFDEESGISYYEVSEDGNPVVRSGSIYVLQNQDDSITPNLVVTAYDKAGNKTTSVYKPVGYALLGVPLNVIVLSILAILVVLFFGIRFAKNRNNAKTQPSV